MTNKYLSAGRVLFVLLAVLLWCSPALAQTGTSCADPISLGGNDTCTAKITSHRTHSWYQFTATNYTAVLTLTSHNISPGVFHKGVLYSGYCGNLTAIDSAEIYPGDTVLTLTRHSLQPGADYFFAAEMNPYGSGLCRTCVDSVVTSSICLREIGDPPFCGFDWANSYNVANSPGYTIQMSTQDQYLYSYVHSHTNIAGPFTIPVVVHVLHQGDAYGTGVNITYEQIQWQIAAMNAAFQHDYAAYNQQTYGANYPYGHQDYSSNPQVRFCLAKIGRDSSLNRVPFFYNTAAADTEFGVMRYDLTQAPYTSVANVGTLNEYEFLNITDEQALLDVTRPGTEFPNSMYMNIYIVPDLCQGTSCNNIADAASTVGVGYMGAFMSQTGQLDGVIFRSDVFGDNSVTGNNFPLFPALNQGKIMDHETGHYLSLYHTFQPDSIFPVGCWGNQDSLSATQPCDGHGDFCCDTPPDTTGFVQPCFGFNSQNTCHETYFTTGPLDHRDMVENYMDYTDDDCYNTITYDQSMRISAMLDVGGPRHSLVTATNLALTGVSNTGPCSCCVLAANISPQGTTTCPGHSVSFFTPSGTGLCATSWTWSFPGGSPSTGTGTTPATTYNAPGVYTVILTASDGVNNITDSVHVIVVVPTVAITATNTALTVCDSTNQNLLLSFTGNLPPYSATICNELNQPVYTVTNVQDSATVVVNVSLAHHIFHICSATNGMGCAVDTTGSGSWSFNVQSCCPSLFVNGDFEDFGNGCNIAPATTQMQTSASCQTYSPSYYGVYVPTTTYGSWPAVVGNTGINGHSMVIDGWTNPINFTPNPGHAVLWSETVPLINGTTYSLQFESSGNHGALMGAQACQPNQVLVFRFKVDNVFFGQTFIVPPGSPAAPWHTFVQDWLCNLPTGTHTIALCQVNDPSIPGFHFQFGAFDYLIDNVTLRSKNIPVVSAGLDTLLCSGGCATIGGPLDSNAVYVWTPSVGLGCDTCASTSACPTVSTTYVVQLTENACVLYDTVAVNISHLNVTAGNNTATCSGQPVTLTATATGGSGNYTYLWLPGSMTTQSVSVNPASVTTYSVIVHDTQVSCGDDTATVTVTPDNLNVVLHDTTKCTGSSVTLIPQITGGSPTFTYLWLPGNQTTATISVSPFTASTYSVIVTDANGCSDTAQATVTPVTAPSLTLTASPDTACVGQTVQLNVTATGSGPFSYSWTPGTGLNSTTINNPVISSYTGSPNTYNVIVTDANGCAAGGSITIKTDSACCVAQNYAPDTLTNQTLTGGTWAVNSTLYINGTVTFMGVDMRMATGVAIIELPGSTLFVTGQSHLYPCHEMWLGVEENLNSTTVVDSSSIIEGAYHGVRTANNAPSTTVLHNAIFNRNLNDVEVQPYSGTVALSITNCRFTSRQLPANPTAASLTYPVLTALPSANLYAPMSGVTSFAAVNTNGAGQVNVGAPSPNSQNIMDNHEHGIYGSNSNVTYKNNMFVNMRGWVVTCPGPPAPCPPKPGIAVMLSDSTMVPGTPSTYNTVIAGGAGLARNYYFNCYQAVDVSDYVYTTITNDSIYSVATVVAPPATTNLNGVNGIYIRTRLSLGMDVRLNGIANQATPIHVILSNGGVPHNSLHINRNNIAAQQTPTTFTNNGILVEGTIAVLLNANNFVFVDSNRVWNAQNDINVRNMPKVKAVIENNTELFIRPSTTQAAGPNSAGIFVTNMNLTFVSQNGNIHSTGTTYSNANHANIRGVYIVNTQATVTCNVTHHTGQSYVFEGSCFASVWKKNDMSLSYDGYVLRNNAVLGPQGNSTHPTDNRWLGGAGSFVHSQTFTDNTLGCNTNSKLYVRSTGVWYPTSNLSNVADPYIPATVGTAFIAATCPPPTIGENNPNLAAVAQKIADDQVDFVEYPAETRIDMQKRLYSDLQEDSTMFAGDTVLQNFTAANQNTSIGLMEDVEKQASEGNVASAAGSNSAIFPGTMPEANQQLLNEIELSSIMIGQPLSASQLADVWSIASQCPEQGGKAVWEARTLLNYVLVDALEFSDSCAPSTARIAPQEHASGINQLTEVFPNPNAGNVTVNYSLQYAASARFEVCDVTGRVLLTVALDPQVSQKQVQLVGLANGAYMYKLIADDRMVSTGTLIVNR